MKTQKVSRGEYSALVVPIKYQTISNLLLALVFLPNSKDNRCTKRKLRVLISNYDKKWLLRVNPLKNYPTKFDDCAKHIYLPSFSGLIKVRNVFITNLFLVFCPQCIVRSSSSQEIKSHVQNSLVSIFSYFCHETKA